jgi:hypothetical protein
MAANTSSAATGIDCGCAKSRRSCRALPILLVALACAPVMAQTETESLYVIEMLVVSVNSAADGSGERVGQIESGDRVEVLEREGEQARVRLESGQEGWVRATYLSASPPMREQLKARTDEVEKLRQEKTKLEADLAGAKKAANAATAAAAAAVAAPPVAASVPPPEPARDPVREPEPAGTDETGDSTRNDNPPIFNEGGLFPSRPSWVAALIASVITLGVGFALGWRVLDRRIRAKYGGLRIY